MRCETCNRSLQPLSAAVHIPIFSIGQDSFEVNRIPKTLQFVHKALDIYPARVYDKDTPRGYLAKGVICVPDEKICACHKIKKRTETETKQLIHRLNRIEGQIRGIRGMVEKDVYCTDILVQVAAVNAALNAFNRELLGNHIRTCVAQDIREGKDETIDELVATLQKLMK